MMRIRSPRRAGGLALAAAVAVMGSGAGNVRAAGSKDVVVVNTPAEPVPTKAVDQPAQQPFADVKALAFDDGEAQKFIEFDPVPGGKRLVIETVTVRTQAAAGQVWDVSMFVTTAGVPVAHNLEAATLQTVTGIDIRSATLPVRFYADAGSEVRLFGHRQGGSTGIAGVRVTISGHYVDVP